MRIAMWSGPRNLSTAMMYAFGARQDCAVVDEPFYAAYLALTGLLHPLREEVLKTQPLDPEEVIRQITGPIPEGRAHFYQKHMTHHMLPGIDRSWLGQMVNVFLIRHPARVIASYVAKRENPALADLGFVQQLEIFREVQAFQSEVTVIDSSDIRSNPARMLARLCEATGLPGSEQMLSWPKGGHKNDGVWASHWYGELWASTGFAGPEGPLPRVPKELLPLLEQALPCYEALSREKI